MVCRQLMLANRGPPPAPKKKRCTCLPKDSAIASKQRIYNASRVESRNISGGQYEVAVANEKQFQSQYNRYTPALYKGFGEVVYVSKILDPKTFTAHNIRQKQRSRLSQQKRVGAVECASCVPDLVQEKLDYEYGKVFGPDARKTLPKVIKTYERYTYAAPPAAKGPVRVKLVATPAIEAPKPKAVKKGKKAKPTYLELVKDGPDIAAFERIAAQEREDRLVREAQEEEARKIAARELLEARVALEAEKVAAQSEAAKIKAAEDAAIKKMELAEKRAARIAREAADAAMRAKIQKEQKDRSLAERRRLKAERIEEDTRIDRERIDLKAKKQAQIEEAELAAAAKREAANKFLEYRRRAEQEWLETVARLAEEEKAYERSRRDAREKRDAKEKAEAQAEAQAEAARREAEAARIAAKKWEEEREEREKREAIEAAAAKEAARVKAIQDEIDRVAAEKLAKETAEREAIEKAEREKEERKARVAAAKAAEEAAKIEEERKKGEAERKKKEEAEKAKAEKAAKAAEAKAKMLAEREAAKAAKAAKDGKKAPPPPPEPVEDEWSCGKVDWNVPEGEKEYGTAGQLNAGDLEFTGHDIVNNSVGKLKVPQFGEAATGPPPKTKSWKKKQEMPDHMKGK